jgi:transcription elongation factor Elf1
LNPINEIEFIYQLSLRKLNKHAKGFNFCCSECNDKKRRAYILIDNGAKGYSTVYCHNCGLSTTVSRFIEMTSPAVYEEYRQAERKEYIEDLKRGKLTQKKQQDIAKILKPTVTDVVNNLKLFKFNTKYFVPASSSPDCVAYAKKRKISDEVFKTLMYNKHPEAAWGNMLIFPFAQGEYVYGFQERELQDLQYLRCGSGEAGLHLRGDH